MQYSSVGILALILHIIINYDILSKSVYAKTIPEYKTYRKLLFAVTAFYITDAFWGILYEKHLIGAVYIDTFLYFTAMAFTIFFWTKYVVSYLNGKNIFSVTLTYAGWTYLIVKILFLFINFFTPVIFSFDKNGVYHTENGRYIVLGFQVLLYLLTAIYTLFINIKSTGKVKFRHRAIGIIGLAMSVLIVIQAAYPFQPLYTVGCLIGTCLLHTFVLEDEKDEQRYKMEVMKENEKKHKKELGFVKLMAYTDSLTGVKNKHAYVEEESRIDKKIEDKTIKEFSLIVFDVNNLKETNDTKGHEEGDKLLKIAGNLITTQFGSKVYRIGGDEFLAILEGKYYRNRKGLLSAFNRRMENNKKIGLVVISTGMEDFRFGKDNRLKSVFERADKKMYERKKYLKNT